MIPKKLSNEFKLVETSNVDNVDFNPGQLIISDNGEAYYDPSIATAIEGRLPISSGGSSNAYTDTRTFTSASDITNATNLKKGDVYKYIGIDALVLNLFLPSDSNAITQCGTTEYVVEMKNASYFCKTGDFGRGNVFVGLKNYQAVLTASETWQSLWNTVKYAIIEVPFGVAIAMVLAFLLQRKIVGKTYGRRNNKK